MAASAPKPALRCGAVEAAGSSVLLDLSRDAIEINPRAHEAMGCSEDLFANSIIVEVSIARVKPEQVLNRGDDNRPYYRRDRHAGRGACESHDAFSASRWPRIDRS